MATKPILKPITPFDAVDGTRLTAVYSGVQPLSNRVVIQDANTLDVVYSRTIETRAFEHYVDPDYRGIVVKPGDVGYSLINGRRYTATIQFFSGNLGETSLASDKISFLTRSTPLFYFDGINDGDTIGSASLILTLIYQQNEYEKLLNFRFYIYNNLKEELDKSEIMYDTTHMTHTFKGLENTEQYYIRAEGTTVNGMALDTGYISIYVWYENPKVYERMYVECDPGTSGMEYFTNFKLIESDEDPASFTYEDGWIDLVGKTLTYSTNFKIEGDATWFIRAKNMDREGDVMVCYNDTQAFRLTSIMTENGGYRYKLIVPNDAYNYVLYSEEFFIAFSDIMNIWVRRINNVYTLKVFQEEVDMRGNYFFMVDAPDDDPDLAKYDIYIDLEETPGIKVIKDNQVIFYQNEEPDDPDKGNVWVD